MRLIDADALLDRIRNPYEQAEVARWVNEQPTIEPERWIPCSERLPAYGEDVLITIDGYCNIGHILRENGEEQYCWFFSGWYHEPNEVAAWMPLPEPYKEGEGC